MKVNFKQVLKSKTDAQETAPNDRHRTITMALAGFTLVGLIWNCFISDIFSNAAKVEPKDYAAEEARNLELAKQDKNGVTFDKLVDESATQYVNEAEEEEVLDEEIEEVTDELDLPEEPEEEVGGEEF